MPSHLGTKCAALGDVSLDVLWGMASLRKLISQGSVWLSSLCQVIKDLRFCENVFPILVFSLNALLFVILP